MDAKGPLVTETRDINELLEDLDKLIAMSKSTWPGRIIVSRRKALALLRPMEQQLARVDVRSEDALRYTEALSSIREFEDIAANSRFYRGPNIWETFFFYGPRHRFKERVSDLRAKLAPFAGA